MKTLAHIAKQVARRVQCDASGSCVVFAAELCTEITEGFVVVEGAVKFKGSIPQDHVWIEADGKRIDPTLAQFSFFRLDTVEYQPAKTYQPNRFTRAIKRHPQRSRFSSLLK